MPMPAPPSSAGTACRSRASPSNGSPLANHRAKVTIRLAALCGKETSAEAVSWFVIDTAVACSKGQAENLAHALTDGRPIAPQESRTAPHVQSARPLCVGARGEAAYRVVAGD